MERRATAASASNERGLRSSVRGERSQMRPLDLLTRWPVIRQMRRDHVGLAASVQSAHTRALRARIAGAEATRSICPYCAVGCGQLVHSRDGEIVQIEGDPDSPISRGRLCPKGSASKSLVTSPLRERKVKYRRPYGTRWEELPLERAMDMIADRVIAARDAGWEDRDDEGRTLRRTMGLANLGGATLDNEENYLIKKLMTSLGVVQVENQARI
jgi:formate dehydrogenase major subunit